MSNHVETLYNMGDDALQNQFQITFALPPAITPESGGESNIISLRVTNLDIPEQSMGTYEVDFRSRKITKPSGKIETGNDFSFTFRVDKEYKTYRSLQRWLNYIGNNKTGALSGDYGANIRTDITVSALNPQTDNVIVTWVLKRCFIKSLAAISFDHSNGEPITVEAQFGFTNIEGSALTIL